MLSHTILQRPKDNRGVNTCLAFDGGKDRNRAALLSGGRFRLGAFTNDLTNGNGILSLWVC